MNIYLIKDYETRKALEEVVVGEQGRTVDKKDAQIKGTVLQLAKVGLTHGQSVWGVPVVATNYQVNNVPKVERQKRGRVSVSKINGQPI